MIRYIFYLVLGYFILKIVRLFIDPMFNGSGSTNPAPAAKPQAKAQPKQEEKKSTLGDYVEYEEVK